MGLYYVDLFGRFFENNLAFLFLIQIHAQFLSDGTPKKKLA